MVLICGVLDDGGRVLFLIRRNQQFEQIELPYFETNKNSDFVSELATEFKRQTNIDGEILEIIHKTRYNSGSRKRKKWDDVLIFKVNAKNRSVRIGSEFSGFRWLTLEDAKKQKISKKFEWLKRLDD
ncbi:MAG: hypothetical protein ABH842_03465 [Candidatus Micrarchaeota archaeon]